MRRKPVIDQFNGLSYLARFKRRNRIEGLCFRCKRKTAPGRTKCKKCLRQYRDQMRRLRKTKGWKEKEKAAKERAMMAAYSYWKGLGMTSTEAWYRALRRGRFPINQPVSVEG